MLGLSDPSRNRVMGRNSRDTTPSCLNFGYPRTMAELILRLQPEVLLDQFVKAHVNVKRLDQRL